MILMIVSPRTHERASARLEAAGYPVVSYLEDKTQVEDAIQMHAIRVAFVDDKIGFAAHTRSLCERTGIPVLPFEFDYQELLRIVAPYFKQGRGVLNSESRQERVNKEKVSTEADAIPEGAALPQTDLAFAQQDMRVRVSQLLRPALSKTETKPSTAATPVVDPTPAQRIIEERIIERERIVEVPVEVPVDRIIERERIIEVPVDRVVEIPVQTGITQRFVVVTSAYPRCGVTLIATLAAQLLAQAHVRVAVIEAPGITPALLDLMDLREHANGSDWRTARPIVPIERDGIAWFPLYEETMLQNAEDHVDTLLRLVYRLRDYPLVLLDAGSQFFHEEIYDIADQVWWVLDSDPVRMARMHRPNGSAEQAYYAHIQGLPFSRVQTVLNRSSRTLRQNRDLFQGAVHLPALDHEALQQALWHLMPPLRTGALQEAIASAWNPLISDWMPRIERKKKFRIGGKKQQVVE